MYFEIAAIAILAASTAVLGLLLKQAKNSLLLEQEKSFQAGEALQKALDAAARADEKVEASDKMVKEFMAKPVQAFIPQGSIEMMTQALTQSLSQSLNAPTGVPIFPRQNPPKGT